MDNLSIMKIIRSAETDQNGLIVWPLRLDQPLPLYPEALNPQTERHHLYWPKENYLERALSAAFRASLFNIVRLSIDDHDKLHARYDGVPIPPREIMAGYLVEADILEELSICLSGITKIDSAIRNGRVKRVNKTLENRQQKTETVKQNIQMIDAFELVPREIANLVVNRAVKVLSD